MAGVAAFNILMLAVAEWSLGYALELAGADVPTKLFWLGFEYVWSMWKSWALRWWPGPLPGIVILLVIGLINILTMAAMAEAVTRNETIRCVDPLRTPFEQSPGMMVLESKSRRLPPPLLPLRIVQGHASEAGVCVFTVVVLLREDEGALMYRLLAERQTGNAFPLEEHRMSWLAINEMLSLAAIDPAFCEQLLSQPLETALAYHFALSPEEQQVLRGVRARDLQEFSRIILAALGPRENQLDVLHGGLSVHGPDAQAGEKKEDDDVAF